MDGSTKYELLQRIAGDRIIAFRGRQIASGQIVLLHQLTFGNDHSDVLQMAVRYLLQSPASTGGRILDLADIQGGTYVVTSDQPECLALREWLKWELEGARPVPAAAPPREVGEFTKLFDKPGAQVAAPGPAAIPVQHSPVRPAAAAPGEFTQLFGRAGEKEAPESSMPSAMPAPVGGQPPAPEKPAPGEFTRLFQSPLSSPADVPSTPVSAAAPSLSRPPGEFTRIFGGMGTPEASAPSVARSPAAVSPVMSAPVEPQSPLIESLEPRHMPTTKPAAAEQGSSAAPGEFTRIIGGGASRPGATSPAGSPGSPAAPATAAPPPIPMSMPSAPTPPSAPAPPSMPAAPPPPSMPAAPSMPGMSAPAAPAPAPGQGKGPPMPVMFILFVVLFLAAVALIVVAVLRH